VRRARDELHAILFCGKLAPGERTSTPLAALVADFDRLSNAQAA
jgi:hypothetical protein